MRDTLDWAALRNPFYGQLDSLDQDLSKFVKPETLLPLESWIFFNRTHWKDIPFLSVCTIVIMIISDFSFV
jgi:hypothetical protein